MQPVVKHIQLRDTSDNADMAIPPKRQKLRNRRCAQRRWCGHLLADRHEAGGLAPENHRPAMPELATRRHACLL
jgi:hypothetical protein